MGDRRILLRILKTIDRFAGWEGNNRHIRSRKIVISFLSLDILLQSYRAAPQHSVLFHKYHNNGWCYFDLYSRREERGIPTAVCKQRATQKTEKELQPEGNVIFDQFLPLSSLPDHKGYAALIVCWNWLKSKHSIDIVFMEQYTGYGTCRTPKDNEQCTIDNEQLWDKIDTYLSFWKSGSDWRIHPLSYLYFTRDTSHLTLRSCRTTVCPDVKVPSGELKIAKQLYTLRPVISKREHSPQIF